jgi:outer membrane protein assembly factor BamB
VAHYGPILAGGRIVIASNDGFLRFFNPVNGALVHQVEVPGGATTAPVVAGQTLYVVSTKGDLHAFR